MELEVGMYVRTKEGNIEKICAIENEHIYTNEDYLSWYPSSNAISKASHNIIDLIEVGDYINGLVVTRICKDIETNEKYINLYGSISEWEEEDIKSIVTKEQFENISYKIGD